MEWKIWYEQALKYLPRIPLTLLVLGVGWVALRVIKLIVVRSLETFKVDETAISLIRGILNFIGAVALIAAVLNTLGLNELALAVSGSIALIAMSIATSASNVTRDLIAGLYLLADDDFSVGRRVNLGGIEGTIVSLSIRKTKLTDDDGNLHIVPNRQIDEKNFVVICKDNIKSKVGS